MSNPDTSSEPAGKTENSKMAPEGAGAAVHSAQFETVTPQKANPDKRHVWWWVIGVVFLIFVLIEGVPWIQKALSTVSTDDAFVNGHVTFVAPRVSGQVVRVLADDNNRVHKGALLVQLDREPYRVQLNIAQTAVDATQADLVAALANTRGITYWMSHLNPWHVVYPRIVVIAGLAMLFAPLNVAAFLYIPKELRGAAVGLLALLRNEGGSVGTSLAQTVLERREQFHTLRLNERLDPLNSIVTQALQQGHAFFLQNTGDTALSRQLTLNVLEGARNHQALALAYFDVFWCSAVLAVLLVFLVLLMRPSVAAKGTHVAAE